MDKIKFQLQLFQTYYCLLLGCVDYTTGVAMHFLAVIRLIPLFLVKTIQNFPITNNNA